MNTIVKWTLRQRKTSTLWWSVGTAATVFLVMIFYPTFKDQGAELEKSFQNLSDTTLQLIGGSSDFFSPIGYLNSQLLFITLPIILAILAIGLGNSILGKEEQDQTIEALLARPISRTKLILSKAISGAIIVSLISLISLVTTVITNQIVGLEVSAMLTSLAVITCWLMSLSLFMIAFTLTASGKARSASLAITSFVALGGYIISSLSGTVDWLKIPAKVFPFNYYDPEAVLRETYNWNNVWFFIAIFFAGLAISVLVFRKRDLS